MAWRRGLWIVGMFAAMPAGCASAAPTGAYRDTSLQTAHSREDTVTERPVPQTELQQDVQRLVGQFMAGVGDALQPLTNGENPELRQAATQRLLLYYSAALDIASGPLPEVNLLDWVVMVSASRAVADKYWVPQVFGGGGRPLAAALAEAEASAWRVSRKVLTADQQQVLRGLIQTWLAEHPQQRAVEIVRLSDFSTRAGTVAAQRAEQVHGLLSNVKQATQAADQAMLMGERALFLVHRLPFVLRLQARLGVQETIDEGLSSIDRVGPLFDELERTRPLLHDTMQLSDKVRGIVHETRQLVNALQPLLPDEKTKADESGSDASLAETLASINRLADSTLLILRETRGLVPEDVETRVDALERRLDHLARRWIAYLVALGGAWAVFFWGGYFLVKRRHREAPPPAPRPSPRMDEGHLAPPSAR